VASSSEIGAPPSSGMGESLLSAGTDEGVDDERIDSLEGVRVFFAVVSGVVVLCSDGVHAPKNKVIPKIPSVKRIKFQRFIRIPIKLLFERIRKNQ
jgi:hypothetical protein